MQNLVAGAKSGDVLEGMSEADATASDKEKEEFQPKKVRLTILKVEEAQLPALDDEFAKKVGSETVEAMRKSIEDLLNARAEEKVQKDLREQINDFLSENYPFDLPKSLIAAETNHRLQQLMQESKFKSEWNRSSEEEKKKIENNVTNEAIQAIRIFYISRKIVQDAKIPVTHKEIQEEAVATMRYFSSPKTDQIPKELFALALSKILLAKAQDFILGLTSTEQPTI